MNQEWTQKINKTRGTHTSAFSVTDFFSKHTFIAYLSHLGAVSSGLLTYPFLVPASCTQGFGEEHNKHTDFFKNPSEIKIRLLDSSRIYFPNGTQIICQVQLFFQYNIVLILIESRTYKLEITDPHPCPGITNDGWTFLKHP